MEPTAFERALAANPSSWRLALGIYPGVLEAVAHSPADAGAFVHRRIAAPEGMTVVKALEDAVYGNPVLLADYGRITCVLASRRVVVAPPGAGDDPDVAEALLKCAFPDWDGEVVIDRLPASNAVMLTGIDHDVAGFLRRTFFNTAITGHLAVLCRYFLTVSRRVNTPAVMVNLRPGSLDIVGVDRGRLLIANTFDYSAIDDAVYYVLAARKEAGMERSTVSLCGDSSCRERLAPVLGRFVTGVMPLIFPSDIYRAGGSEAMNSPFELIVLPVCE